MSIKNAAGAILVNTTLYSDLRGAFTEAQKLMRGTFHVFVLIQRVWEFLSAK